MLLRQKENPDVELSGKLGGKSLFRQIIALALWPFLQNLMMTIVSFVDMMIAGGMESHHAKNYAGDGDVATLMIEMMGPIAYIIWLLMILQSAVGMGAQALVARANGAKDRLLAERAFGQSVLLGVVSGTLGGLIVYLFTDQIVTLANITPEAGVLAKEYIHVIVWSAPLTGLLLVVNSCLRASGDTFRPFFAMCLVNVTNAVLSALFVYGPGSIGGHGATGIAIGTVLAWGAGVIVILFIVKAKNREYSIDEHMVLKPKYIKPNKKLSIRILRIAAPNAIEVLGMCIIHMIGFRFVANIGKRYAEQIGVKGEGVIVGAHSVAIRVESLSFMPAFAFGLAAATLAGQYLGAESVKFARYSVRYCWGLAVLTMSLSGLVMFIFAEELVTLLFQGEGEQRAIAVGIIGVSALAQPFFASSMVLKMSMRGAGATKLVMFYTFLIMISVRVLLLGWYTSLPDSTVIGAWWIMSLDLFIQTVVFFVLYIKGGWTKVKV